MTWCPRCDLVTEDNGGRPCSVCGAETIDPGREGRTSSRRTLVLDAAPGAEIDTIAPIQRRRFSWLHDWIEDWTRARSTVRRSVTLEDVDRRT